MLIYHGLKNRFADGMSQTLKNDDVDLWKETTTSIGVNKRPDTHISNRQQSPENGRLVYNRVIRRYQAIDQFIKQIKSFGHNAFTVTQVSKTI